ncbi:protein phosphatase 2C domain-containing protein [Chitinophaga sedimenti]|uniref:PP2C family serine/threonine-protein phosphatase n=1 Tax=Chitinophaga sedimenti TaxID=2033606 RepID=UPI002004955E|nr:PP2C family serine/threonine-protein phosphatase [Chitinophaga sedimenti]MCK7553983.1 protein phosphatase 2C domain-containing protein [Chitinophaga sedimenti]
MVELFLKQLLTEFNIVSGKFTDNTIARLLHNAKINELTKAVAAAKKQAIDIFHLYKETEEFKDAAIVLPNAVSGKQYEHLFDLSLFPNINVKKIRQLDKSGLSFDPASAAISGVPTSALTLDLQLAFTCGQGEAQIEDIKVIPFIVNADPKDLWLNKPSNKNDLFAKEDSDKYAGAFLDKHVVVASQRGRSHAHEGSFRDDHFYTRKLPLDWEIIAVADGAGSAKFSRQGSKIATTFIADSFNEETLMKELCDRCTDYFSTIPEKDPTPEEAVLKHKSAIINILYKSVRNLHAVLNDFARQEAIQLKDLNTTLIFALVRKFDSGYVVLTFGVGDCPVNIITDSPDEVKLLNQLDIGEFGGGTRFITMPEIFTNDIAGRFAINRFTDFSQLVLMTDGIYDPKFVTENKLEDKSAWDTFFADLGGGNEDNINVDFSRHEGIEDRLLSWLNFWSKGNHDDRTLAIIY